MLKQESTVLLAARMAQQRGARSRAVPDMGAGTGAEGEVEVGAELPCKIRPWHSPAHLGVLFPPGCTGCLGDATFLTFCKYQAWGLCQGRVCAGRSREGGREGKGCRWQKEGQKET